MTKGRIKLIDYFLVESFKSITEIILKYKVELCD
jgi:hypothetical protein